MNQNTIISIQEIEFEFIVYKMTSICLGFNVINGTNYACILNSNR